MIIIGYKTLISVEIVLLFESLSLVKFSPFVVLSEFTLLKENGPFKENYLAYKVFLI